MILNLFWDLRWFPVNYEITQWLLMAELYRQRVGADGMRLLVVPPYDGQRLAKEHIRPPEVEMWRVWNQLVPVTRLVPSVKGVHVLADRAEAKDYTGPSFPGGFDIDAPKDNPPFKGYKWWFVLKAAASSGLPSLVVQEPARRNMAKWLEKRARGRKAVVVVLREDTRYPTRNTNWPEWHRFIATLDRVVYFPIVLRDASAIYEVEIGGLPAEGVCQFAPASLNVELRAALYELSHVVMGTTSGNMALAMLNHNVRYLMFINPVRGTEMDKKWFKKHGFVKGTQPPLCRGPHQKWIWAADNYGEIAQAFASYEAERIAA